MFELISNLDIFLFEMRNATAACSTVLLNPDQKAHYFNDYSLSDISKRKTASSGHAHLFPPQYNRANKQNKCAKLLLNH